jgi:hypothetical protein
MGDNQRHHRRGAFMRSFRVPFLARIGALTALLLGGGCSGLPSIAGPPAFHADALVGPETWSFTDLTLRPSIQQSLYAKDVMDLFVDPARSAGIDLNELPTPSGRTVNFERDVLPHLDGEVVVAVSGPTDDPRVTLLVHTNDIDGTLRLVAEEAQPKLIKDARGATHYDPQDGSNVIVGYKNWVVFTRGAAERDRILDRIDGKGSPGLASDARYRSVVERLTGDRLGYGYFDVSAVIEDIPSEDARLVQALQARGRLAYSLGVGAGPEPKMRALELRMEYIPDDPRPSPVAASGDALNVMDQLPKGSMLAIGGSSIGLYADSVAALGDDERIPAELQTLLQQLAGPYALAVTPPNAAAAGSSDALSDVIGGLFFVAGLVPDADVDFLQSAIETIAEDTAADTDEADSFQHQVFVDNNLLVLNVVPATTDLDALPQDLLASDQVYQSVRSGFSPNGSNVYVNVDAVFAAFARQISSMEELEALTPVRAIGLAAQTAGQGDVHANIRVIVTAR